MRHFIAALGLLSLVPLASLSNDNCCGDCDGDGEIAISEIVLGVAIVLQRQPVDRCCAFSGSCTALPTISDLISAVRASLNGCGCTDVLSSFAGRDSVCVFRGPYSSECPTERIAISFETIGGSFTRPIIALDVASPVVSFRATGTGSAALEREIDRWAPSRRVDSAGEEAKGRVEISEDGQMLTVEIDSPRILIDGCAIDRFVGTFVGLEPN